MMLMSSQTAGSRWRDPAMWMAAPAVIFMLAVFVYPFIHGLILSFQPLEGGMLSNYIKFFSTDNLWMTIGVTLKLALPATLINILIAVPVAYRLRHKTPYQKIATTILVIPITLGTVLIAKGMLTYFGPKGWFAHILQLLHVYEGAIRLTHNYAGVLISLIISGFPFAFLLILSYITGIDPVLPRAAATLGATPFNQFRYVILPLILPGLAMAFCLSFVQAFSVVAGAVKKGNPDGGKGVMWIAAGGGE